MKPNPQTTYTKTLVCKNCGQRTTREIPKGTTVKWYIETHGCENCGCDKLSKKEVTVKGWIGDTSYLSDPLTYITCTNKESSILFRTKQDAILAGWKKPRRVEVKVRLS